ncbi:MAG: hypothetical protein GQ574_28765 [Crocinitomix sp.]|nr:hypothetical protein [Crocinitomix sp.]
MDRYEFLIALWKKGLKPILLVVGIYFCITFIYYLFNEGSMWSLLLLILSIALFILFIELIGSLFSKIILKISAKTPVTLKIWLRFGLKILNYLSPFILAIIIYQAWQKHWKGTAFVIGILFLQKIIDLQIDRKVLKKSN